MDKRKLIANAILAGAYTAAGILLASNQPVDRAALFAAAVAGIRFALGFFMAKSPGLPAIPLDQ